MHKKISQLSIGEIKYLAKIIHKLFWLINIDSQLNIIRTLFCVSWCSSDILKIILISFERKLIHLPSLPGWFIRIMLLNFAKASCRFAKIQFVQLHVFLYLSSIISVKKINLTKCNFSIWRSIDIMDYISLKYKDIL